MIISDRKDAVTDRQGGSGESLGMGEMIGER